MVAWVVCWLLNVQGFTLTGLPLSNLCIFVSWLFDEDGVLSFDLDLLEVLCWIFDEFASSSLEDIGIWWVYGFTIFFCSLWSCLTVSSSVLTNWAVLSPCWLIGFLIWRFPCCCCFEFFRFISFILFPRVWEKGRSTPMESSRRSLCAVWTGLVDSHACHWPATLRTI